MTFKHFFIQFIAGQFVYDRFRLTCMFCSDYIKIKKDRAGIISQFRLFDMEFPVNCNSKIKTDALLELSALYKVHKKSFILIDSTFFQKGNLTNVELALVHQQ